LITSSDFCKKPLLSSPESKTQKLALPALTLLVVGGMVGAGIFSLPRANRAVTCKN